MRPGQVWTLAAALCLAAALLDPWPVSGAERPRPRPNPPAEPPPVEAAPALAPFEVRFDFEVVERYLTFEDHGGATREELQQWVRLPGNRELLRQGRSEGGLTSEILMEAVRVSLSGQEFHGPAVLGRFTAGDGAVLRQLVDAIRARQDEFVGAAAGALRPYLPKGRQLPPFTVYFHLGGSWDGRTSDAVYINLTLFQARAPQGVAGLHALLVHELFHQAHSFLFPGIDDYSSPQSGLYSLLLRLQQEGIARYLECQYLRRAGAGTDLDRISLDRYLEGLRRAPEHVADLEGVREMMQRNRMLEARHLAGEGFQSGGPLYAIGHRMAESIATGAGEVGLARTISEGPVAFARAYERAARDGDASLFTTLMRENIRELRHGYGRDPARASRLRREGLALIESQQVNAAVAALTEAAGLDPSDATSAYNLACAHALSGNTKPALKWLGRSFDRGFANYKHAAMDEDLIRLRDRPEFEAMLRERGFDYRRPKAPVTP